MIPLLSPTYMVNSLLNQQVFIYVIQYGAIGYQNPMVKQWGLCDLNRVVANVTGSNRLGC
jgi:hypothetical protein